MIELQNVANPAFSISLENLLSIVAALTAIYQFTPEYSPPAKKIKNR